MFKKTFFYSYSELNLFWFEAKKYSFNITLNLWQGSENYGPRVVFIRVVFWLISWASHEKKKKREKKNKLRLFTKNFVYRFGFAYLLSLKIMNAEFDKLELKSFTFSLGISSSQLKKNLVVMSHNINILKF